MGQTTSYFLLGQTTSYFLLRQTTSYFLLGQTTSYFLFRYIIRGYSMHTLQWSTSAEN